MPCSVEEKKIIGKEASRESMIIVVIEARRRYL